MYKINSDKTAIVITISIIITGIWLYFFFSASEHKNIKPESYKSVSIATISPSFTGYTLYVALEKGCFQAEGLNVNLQTFPHGKAVLDALAEGKAEVGTCSETPFMHAVLKESEIYAIAVTATAEKHLGLVCRKDKGILTVSDLKGKSIGVTFGTNGQYFMDTVLLLHGILSHEINAVHLKPDQMFDALMHGEVDAISTWNPQMHKARKSLGDQGNTFYAKGIYTPLFLAVARKDYVHANPETIEKIIRALIRATRFIQDNPDESRKIVASHLNTDVSLMNELKADYLFKISLDQFLITILEEQAKWAIKHHLTDTDTVPNYLNYIYTDALESVQPENVTILKP